MGLLLTLLLGCHSKVILPDVRLAAQGVVWPDPPDPPRVALAGSVELPAERMLRPLGVACGPGELAIADADAGAVWVVDLSTGRVRAHRRAGGGYFEAPVAVAYSSDGALWVVDSSLGAVVRREPGKRKLEIVASGEPLQRPAGLVGWQGDVLVLDTLVHGMFRVGDGPPRPFGPGRGVPGQGLNFPLAAAVGLEDVLFVVDGVGATVQAFDGARLRLVAGGADATTAVSLVRPKGIAVDSQGRLHVVDAGMQHVVVLGPDGALHGRYGTPGSGGADLALPTGVCIDGDHVYVADSLNRRIQMYVLLDGGEP